MLVVDDNEDAGRALAELLEITGCETTTAATGKEALARSRESGIDHHLVKPVGVEELLRLFSAHQAG